MWGKRLNTKARLSRFGWFLIICARFVTKWWESLMSIFLNKCRFSTHCMQDIKDWLGGSGKFEPISGTIRWVQRQNGCPLWKKVLQAAMVYIVWKVRNEVIWSQKILSVKSAVNLNIWYSMQSRVILAILYHIWLLIQGNFGFTVYAKAS